MKRLALLALLLLTAVSAFGQATVTVQPAAPTYSKLILTNVSFSFAAKEPGQPLVEQPTLVNVTYQFYSDGQSKYDQIQLTGDDAIAFLRAFMSYGGTRPEGLVARRRGIDDLIAKGKIAGVTADTP